MPLSTDLVVTILFALFAAIQIFYYLFFFIRLPLHQRLIDKLKGKEQYLPEPQIQVSIIICAFNEEANLKKNLPLFLDQKYFKNNKPFFEVLVVNDNSEDGSFYLLNQMQEVYPHLHIVNLTQEAKLIPGKKFPLSMGIKSARFEHLLLTDADCIPASDTWLSEMASGFNSDKKIVLGYSPYFKYEGWLNKKIRFETVHSAMQYLNYALAKIPYMGVGRNLAYQRELFNQNKGFSSHHHFVSGDDDLFINQVANSKNTSIVINPEAFTYSEPKKTEEEWHYQKKRHLSTGTHYKKKHQFLLGLYAFSHFAFWVSLILCIIFPQYLLLTGIIFIIRWLIQWFVFQLNFIRLQEEDLINTIWLFDLWLLFYNIKSLPHIFIKSKIHWK